MHPGSTKTEQAYRLLPYFSQLGWIPAESVSTEDPSAHRQDVCYLRLLAENKRTEPSVRRFSARLHQLGYTLRDIWAEREHYLEPTSEPQLLFGHRRFFATETRFATIACSQLGRDGHRLPSWPSLLEYVAHSLSRDQWTLLIPSRTTLAEAALPIAQQAGLAYAQVETPPAKLTWLDWLNSILRLDPDDESLRHQLRVSPALADSQGDVAHQDRFAVAFAERLVVLYLRAKGKLIGLVQQRLEREQATERSPSVRVLISRPDQQATDSFNKSPIPKKNAAIVDTLLAKGAVGWYLPSSERTVSPLPSPCRSAPVDRPAQQVMMNIDLFANRFGTDWPFLTHCTRGSPLASPDESPRSSQFRHRIEGYQQSFSPLETLCRIASQNRLLGSNARKRTRFRSISFSACRLTDLLKRRAYRSHLGRWDWEPYGLLIERGTLQSLGANPVRYGDEQVFHKLPTEEQPFFQPVGKTHQWEEEQEWRLLGDLRLDSIPKSKVFLFCATKRQATALACSFPWTVLYQS